MKPKYPVYYARHKYPSSVVSRLLAEGCVGFDFDLGATWDAATYTTSAGKSSCRNMLLCDAHESIVVAQYQGVSSIYMGLSKTGSRRLATWPGAGSDTYAMKLLQIQSPRAISIQEFSLPFLNAPPQSTFVHWQQCEYAVNAFFLSEGAFPLDPSFLSWQYEILAEEWLRETKRLSRKLFKTGLSLKSFDVVGLNSQENLVLAQVKYTSTIGQYDEFADLVAAFPDVHGYYFCGGALGFPPRPCVERIDLDTVYVYFEQHAAIFLKKLLYGLAAR